MIAKNDINELMREFSTPDDNAEQCKFKIETLGNFYTWEEIADLYWQFRREKLHYDNFEDILNWITKKVPEKADKMVKYAGSKRIIPKEMETGFLEGT